jgi:hypothetical protein
MMRQVETGELCLECGKPMVVRKPVAIPTDRADVTAIEAKPPLCVNVDCPNADTTGWSDLGQMRLQRG